LVSIYQLAITIGIFSAYLVDEAFAHDEAWRIMFAIGVVPAALLIAGMLTLPESPRWLVAHARRDDARAVLGRLEDTADPDAELRAIDAALADDADTSWRCSARRCARARHRDRPGPHPAAHGHQHRHLLRTPDLPVGRHRVGTR